MECVVTGGAGFIGSNLTDKLIELGHNVCIIDNLSTGKREYINPKAQFMSANFKENITIPHKVDVIFHLGAQSRIQPSFESPIETCEINVIGTMQILQMAIWTGARIVYAGSSSFYGDPHKNPYALSKWMGEELCLMYNQVYSVPTAIARFFNVYGPRQPKIGQYATVLGIFERQMHDKQALTVTGTGEQKRDFVHVFDVVDGLIAMSHQPWNGEIFNLGTGKNYSINTVAKMFNSKIDYIPARCGEAFETLADISFTNEKLNWYPKIELPNYIGNIKRPD